MPSIQVNSIPVRLPSDDGIFSFDPEKCGDFKFPSILTRILLSEIWDNAALRKISDTACKANAFAKSVREFNQTIQTIETCKNDSLFKKLIPYVKTAIYVAVVALGIFKVIGGQPIGLLLAALVVICMYNLARLATAISKEIDRLPESAKSNSLEKLLFILKAPALLEHRARFKNIWLDAPHHVNDSKLEKLEKEQSELQLELTSNITELNTFFQNHYNDIIKNLDERIEKANKLLRNLSPDLESKIVRLKDHINTTDKCKKELQALQEHYIKFKCRQL